MAELIGNVKRGSGRTRSKQVPRVDLTAMVDLAFLLITFFMLTTTLAKQRAMDMAMPVKSTDPIQVSEDRTLTLCLGKENKLLWYKGNLEKPIISPVVSNYGRAGIHKTLVEQGKIVHQITGDIEKGMIVLIKPSDKSNYKNLVDILDEMRITNVLTYAISYIEEQEILELKRNKIY